MFGSRFSFGSVYVFQYPKYIIHLIILSIRFGFGSSISDKYF